MPTKRYCHRAVACLLLALAPACQTPAEGTTTPAAGLQPSANATVGAARLAPRLEVTVLVNVFAEKRPALLAMLAESLASCRVAPESGTELLVTLGIAGKASVLGLDEAEAGCVAGELGGRVTRQERQGIYFRANGSKVGTIRVKVP